MATKWEYLSLLDNQKDIFECYVSSVLSLIEEHEMKSLWYSVDFEQREKLLKLICLFTKKSSEVEEYDVIEKFLRIFWVLAHFEENYFTDSNELQDQAFSGQLRIWEYCSKAQKKIRIGTWLMDLIVHSKWVLPALKKMNEICCLWKKKPKDPARLKENRMYRDQAITILNWDFNIIVRVVDDLILYLDQARHNPYSVLFADKPENIVHPQETYNHPAQVKERLKFLKFILRDGERWLCLDEAKRIWNSLVLKPAVFPWDMEVGFKWFYGLMNNFEQPDLDPQGLREFFEDCVQKVHPILVTELGFKCFDRFFKTVNCQEDKLIPSGGDFYLMNTVDLTGTEYVWKLISSSRKHIAIKALELLKAMFTNLGPKFKIDSNYYRDASCISVSFDRIQTIIHENVEDKEYIIEQEKTKMFEFIWNLFDGRNWYHTNLEIP